MLGINEGVDFALRPVQWLSLSVPSSNDGFDFLEPDGFTVVQQAVNATPDLQGEIVRNDAVLERNLFGVTRRP